MKLKLKFQSQSQDVVKNGLIEKNFRRKLNLYRFSLYLICIIYFHFVYIDYIYINKMKIYNQTIKTYFNYSRNTIFNLKSFSKSKTFLFSTKNTNDQKKSMTYEEKVEYYETEFNKIYEDHDRKVKSVIEKEISNDEKVYLNGLCDEILKLKSEPEKKAFLLYTKELLIRLYNIDFTKVKSNYPYYNQKNIKFWPQDNPNWGSLEMEGGMSSSSANSEKDNLKVEKKEKEKEEVKQKQIMDIKLVSFDAAKKINLIKDMRSALNLGLKEAKDLIESAPVILKTNVPTTEAEQFKEKFKELCKIELI